MAESVKVVVRCRPMNTRELTMKCKNVVSMDSERCTCSVKNPSDNTAPPKSFTFDGVYSINSTTEQIYNESAYPLIEGVLEGYNSTVFAYGQTGCGKSFTMQGIQDPPMQRGIIPRAFEHIFEAIAVAQGVKFLVLASYLEIYNEEIRDLLGCDLKRKLDLKETPDRGVYVQDLSWHAVGSVQDCEKLMAEGWSHRSTGATLMNADSSRSHSIFSVCVEMMKTLDQEEETSIRRGKLSLVDLAGSERQTKTGATGERLKEASKINLSLSALGNVISALVDGKAKHIPYRDSKLTRLLQDSLGGNTKTLMIACLSPADNNYDESLSTLRYANRAKNIRNKPHINEDPKDTLLRQYQEEIEKLKNILETSTTPKLATIVDEAMLQKEREKVKMEYENELSALRAQFKEMHSTKCQVQEEFDTLKVKFEKQIKNINEKSVLQPNSLTIVDNGEKIKEETVSELNNNCDKTETSDDVKGVIKPSRQEIMARLAKLERNLVGGEKAGDQNLRERRARRKRAAERRLAALADVLSKEDNSADIVLGVVDDMADQLSARSEHLKKHRMKVKALEREIQDLQSEFETERTDYLETIRRLERQLKLHSQIIERILPVLRNQYNYSDIESIKREAKWEDDSPSWLIPDLISLQSKLPPAEVWRQTSLTAPGRLQKNGRSDDEDFAGSYFKPKRAAELLVRAQQDAARATNISSRKPIRLEALPVLDKKNSKPQLNTLDII